MSVVSQSPTDDSPPVSPSTEKKASRWARIKTKTQDLQATLDMANLTNDLSERGIDFQKLQKNSKGYKFFMNRLCHMKVGKSIVK